MKKPEIKNPKCTPVNRPASGNEKLPKPKIRNLYVVGMGYAVPYFEK